MSEIPLKPLGKNEIKKLELALIFGTLFRPDVIERVKNSEDRLTWLDSLVVAAASIARQKAGYTVSMIADEVGRSEATVRNHLEGKTEAGKLVRETLKFIAESGGKLEIKLPPELEAKPLISKETYEKIRSTVEEVSKTAETILKEKESLSKALEGLQTSIASITEGLTSLSNTLNSLMKALEGLIKK